MLAKCFGCAIVGIIGHTVDIEVHITKGLPALNVVGLPDISIKEARERVRSGIVNSGFEFPKQRITVNLAPADLRKEGSAFDLAIALGILGAAGIVDQDRLAQYIAYGELSLDGCSRGVEGSLLAADLASTQGFTGTIISSQNRSEAALIKTIQVIAIENLRQAVEFLNGVTSIDPAVAESRSSAKVQRTYDVDYAEVKGQHHAKRALEIAAAGGHHSLLVGPPGAGKSMLAQRLPTILPEMSEVEAIEVTKIRSVAGIRKLNSGLVLQRPFRSPHHTISYCGLAGGGANPRPGEISLSHHGVLFLDELPEFQRNVIESLRQPLESAMITITRASASITFPCRFMLVAAMNPCPCGFYGDRIKSCTCTLADIYRYRRKLSGPMLDRFDIRIEVPHLERHDLLDDRPSEDSNAIRDRVLSARERQARRYREVSANLMNSNVPYRSLRKKLLLKPEATTFLETLVERFRLSGRSFDRLLRVSATIADLADVGIIESDHIAEASQYRGEVLEG